MYEITEVSNIHCPKCHRNMWFSPDMSSDMIAVFHCVNEECSSYNLHLTYDETDWDRVDVERITE